MINRRGIRIWTMGMMCVLGASVAWGDVFQGTLQVMTHDKIDGTVEYFHELQIGNDRWVRLEYPTADSRTLYSRTGERIKFDTFRREVKVDGTLRDGRIYVDRLTESSRSRFSAPPLPEPEPYTGGKIEKTALQIVIWVGGNGLDPDDAHHAIFGETGTTTNAFYDEGSYGTFKLVGINDPGGDTYRADVSSCSNAKSLARNAANQAGFPVSDYDVVLHTFPSGTCGSGGVAGGRDAHVYVSLRQLWDFGAHEIGHCNVLGGGLGHASSVPNGTSASGNTVTWNGSTSRDEYGDQSDIMGGRNFQFCSWHIERAGWLPEGNRLDLTESRRVTLLPINLPGSGVQSLMVPRSSSQYFHFEFRRPVGFDQNVGSGLTDGVLVRVAGEPNRRSNPLILDMTPGNNFRDAALREGRTFRSTQGDDDLEVTVVEVTDEHAIVDVIIDGEPVTPINEEAIRKQTSSKTFHFILPGSKALGIPLGALESVHSVEVMSPQGKTVRVVNPRENGIRWNGTDSNGKGVLSGVYFFRFNTNQRSILRRAVVLP